MNGKKILNRLIILFACINLILLIGIGVRKQTQYQLTPSRVSNIVDLLEQKGIVVVGTLPRDYSPRVKATLTYTGDNVTVRNDMVKTFFGSNLTKVTRSTENSKVHPGSKVYYFTKENEQLAFDKARIMYTNTNVSDTKPSIKEAKMKAEAFIKRLEVGKLYKSAKVEVREEGNKVILTYFPTFEGLPLFDLSTQMIIGKNGVENAEIYLGEVTALEEGKERIIPIDLVLFENEAYIGEEENRMIKEITLGYKKLDRKGSNLWGEQIVPMYKIEVDGLEKPLFVNAYTNEIVK